MKYITIILLLIFTGCKNETRPEIQTEALTENEIDNSVYNMWQNYTASHPEFQNVELPESWYFHNNKADANRLANLVLSGKKQAASGLYAWYKEADADLPKTGLKHIITDFDGKAKAIIEIKKVDTIPFHKISEAYAALDMGTTTDPLQKWKNAHWDFFSTTMVESGETPTEDLLIVCEEFETIWPE
ncbi:ASCH domain-containing protein [Winogradskyella psychrotolerans]|uniref:ASCH domain-containing protein n=1 Tax=Winogradskyella psychrotolerans TaxID=1344585 RepID=UPI001C077967|nr:ASCH domain-containing protein [Winogradskyella psychrotolerans]MBU2926930.1 ASCH domain-containing protein [Winogradskyella psychrotolerans]